MSQRTITLTLTDAGRELLLGENAQGIDVPWTHIALGSGTTALDNTATALAHEQERRPIFSASEPMPGVEKLSAQFDDTTLAAQYNATEIGLYSNGTLFGVWSTTSSTQALVVRTPGVPYTASISVGIGNLPAQNITITIQPLDAAVQVLLSDTMTSTINTVFARMAPISDVGVANAYRASNVVPLTAATLVNGVRQRVVIKATNTGASTYAPDGLAAAPVFGLAGAALQGGELVAGGIADLEYTVSSAINAGVPVWILKSGAPGAMQLPGGSYGKTPAQSDRSTKLATTEFVQDNISASNLFPVIKAPFSGTLADSDYNCTVQMGGDVTLPSIHRAGGVVHLFNDTGSSYTVSAASGDLIYYPPAGEESTNTGIVIGPGMDVWLVNRGTSEWDVISGSYILANNSVINFGARQGAVVYISATNSSAGQGLVIDGNGGAHGAEIALLGDGSRNTATPDKFLRSNSGNFEVISSDYKRSLFAVSDAGNANLPGNLTLFGDLAVNFNSGSQKGLRLYSSGVPGISTAGSRWYMYADGTSESGNNAGSNYVIGRFGDDGIYIDNPVFISRKTGVASFNSVPQHPTPAPFDASTQSATTSFVQKALGNRSGVILIGSTITLDVSAYGAAAQFINSAAITVTLPAQDSRAGGSILFYHQGAAAATINPQSGGFIHVTVSGSSLNLSSITLQPGDTVELIARGGSGTEWDVVGGTWATRYSTVLPVNDTGTANAYKASNAAPLTTATLVQGTRQRVVIKNTNTGPSTYAPDGLGTSPIFGLAGGALQGGELVAGGIADLEYTFSAAINAGVQVWILKSCAPGAMQIPGGSYAPTPAQFDATTKLATTAFVQRSLGNFSGHTQLRANTTLTASQAGVAFQFAASNITATLPDASALPQGAAFAFYSNGTSGCVVQTIGTAQGFGNGKTAISLNVGDNLTVEWGGGEWNIISGSAAIGSASVFKNSLSPSGYQMFPGGLIVQWGTFLSSGTTDPNASVTFPIQFPTNCLQVTPTVGGEAVGAYTVQTTSFTKTGASLSAQNASGMASGVGGNYIAIGF